MRWDGGAWGASMWVGGGGGGRGGRGGGRGGGGSLGGGGGGGGLVGLCGGVWGGLGTGSVWGGGGKNTKKKKLVGLLFRLIVFSPVLSSKSPFAMVTGSKSSPLGTLDTLKRLVARISLLLFPRCRMEPPELRQRSDPPFDPL